MGTLLPGSWADFIIIDRDMFAIPPEQLWQIEVQQTFVNGKQVFTK